MSLVAAVLPLALVIALGYGLARSGMLPQADWKGIETLSFRVLIPAVLIVTLGQGTAALQQVDLLALALLGSWAVLAGLALALRLLPRAQLSDGSFTTVFQLAARWNGFIALAAAEQFLGAPGLAVVALAMGILIPVINILCIVVLSVWGPGQTRLSTILNTVLRNPLVQACALGLGIHLSGIAIPAPIAEALDMVGRGALAVGLLAVGAGISLRRLIRLRPSMLLAVLLRPLIAPVIWLGIAQHLGLTPVLQFAGVLVFAAPAAANGYIIAKKMGGDAGLYADVMTWQTLLSLIALPIWAGYLLG